MALSSNLISQFVKITNDEPEEEVSTVVYGTAKKVGGEWYAQLDGSEQLVPVESTASLNDGDRVVVNIENHSALITGNLTDQAASSGAVAAVTTEMEVLTVTVSGYDSRLNLVESDLDIVNTTISSIDSEIKLQETTIDSLRDTITSQDNRITMVENEITMVSSAIDIADSALEVANSAISIINTSFEIEGGVVTGLKGIDGLVYITTEQLTADHAQIEYLEGVIADLDMAKIDALYAEVANIQTVLAGSVGTGLLETIHLTGENAVIETEVVMTAIIGNANIGNLVAGIIYTDYIKIANNEGQNVLFDSGTIQFWDDNGTLRIQQGEDASGDYNFYLWNEDGSPQWNAKGITETGISGNGGIIKDMAVADDAAIKGSKLDIQSVAYALNDDGSLVVDAANVTINGEQLSASYTQLVKDVDNLSDDLTVLQTDFSVVQGQITAKVWESDIQSAIDGLEVGARNYLRNTRTLSPDSIYTHTSSSSSSHFAYDGLDENGFGVWEATPGTSNYYLVMHTGIDKNTEFFGGQPLVFTMEIKAPNLTSCPGGFNLVNGLWGTNDGGLTWYRTTYKNCKFNYSGFTTNKDEWVDNEWVKIQLKWTGFELSDYSSQTNDPSGYSMIYYCWEFGVNSDNTATEPIYIRKPKLEIGSIATDWSPAPEDVEDSITVLTDKYADLEVTADSISMAVGSLSSSMDELEENVAELVATSTEINMSVSSLITDIYGDEDQGIAGMEERLKSEMSLTAEELSISFTAQIADVEAAAEDASNRVDTISSYFEFSSDGLKISASNTSSYLLLGTNKISFSNDVAYITDSLLNIYDAYILDSLRIGRFAFVPRDSGHLSLVLVET